MNESTTPSTSFMDAPIGVFAGVAFAIGALSSGTAAAGSDIYENETHDMVPVVRAPLDVKPIEVETGSVVLSDFDHVVDHFYKLSSISSKAEDVKSPGRIEFFAMASTRPIDQVLSNLRDLTSLNNGWDGPDSVAPKASAIDDAITVAHLWPADIPIPIDDVDVLGNVILDILDEDGFTVGGFEFSGEEHSAIVSVVKGSEILLSKSIRAVVPSDIQDVFNEFRRVLA